MHYSSTVALLALVLFSGCVPSRTVRIDWSPALVDTIRTHAPVEFKWYRASEGQAADARMSGDDLEIRFEDDTDWTRMAVGEVEYFRVPGPLRPRIGQSMLLGALAGGIVLSIVARRSVSDCKYGPGGNCAYAAAGLAAASGFMAGALGGGFIGLFVGMGPKPSLVRYEIDVLNRRADPDF